MRRERSQLRDWLRACSGSRTPPTALTDYAPSAHAIQRIMDGHMSQAPEAASERRVSANSGTGGEVSLVRGGPFYRAQEAARLLAPDRWNLGRRAIFAIAIGWSPLVLLTLLFNRR